MRSIGATPRHYVDAPARDVWDADLAARLLRSRIAHGSRQAVALAGVLVDAGVLPPLYTYPTPEPVPAGRWRAFVEAWPLLAVAVLVAAFAVALSTGLLP